SHPLRRVHECRGTRSRYPRISRSSQHPSDPFRLDQIRRRHSRKGRQRATSVRVTTLAPIQRSAPEEEDEARRAAFIRQQIETIVGELVPLSGTPGEQYLREKRRVDTDGIADILARIDAIGWHPAAYFNQPDPSKPHHEFHGRRLGCIAGR